MWHKNRAKNDVQTNGIDTKFDACYVCNLFNRRNMCKKISFAAIQFDIERSINFNFNFNFKNYSLALLNAIETP